MKLFHVAIISGACVIAGASYVFFMQRQPVNVVSADTAQVIVLAQCLHEQGITMYGSRYCKYCEQQKRNFGAAWDYVPYVECEDNRETCAQKNVIAYPTWVLADGTRIIGEQSFEKLALLSNCPVDFSS